MYSPTITISPPASRVKTYKVAVLGSGGVGKSCLSLRYVKSTFVDIYDPTIEDAFRHQTGACVGPWSKHRC